MYEQMTSNISTLTHMYCPKVFAVLRGASRCFAPGVLSFLGISAYLGEVFGPLLYRSAGSKFTLAKAFFFQYPKLGAKPYSHEQI
jgi:hypothetical protein